MEWRPPRQRLSDGVHPKHPRTAQRERPAEDEALAWAAAGVCVLQQSLPQPFHDVLLYGDTDNRPAHRILFAYASLLKLKDPGAAGPWFTALVHLNPPDNVGARFFAPEGPQVLSFQR
ncbi:hypothetical protein [Streptomyces avidinii]|uniref:Uncharacterized protein n=1 Tax=Streptomyces avidinii TaxID=1895 RepID=A0ABS4L6X5_STRAV|nr:hypothetical protein [Streptomyces avidinii]MBP2037839.1 hypothetical protein [Streptomyces avidinii]GGZ08318.1 hypothetical protein GCM10010343_38170 [Streptomyces avidinii]